MATSRVCRLLEQVSGQVLRAAGIDRAEIELAGILARELHHVLQRLERRILLDGEKHLERSGDRHLGEVGQHVVGPRLEQRHADGLAVAGDSQGIAVGRRAERAACRQRSAGARPVLNDELLAGVVAELLRQEAHGEVADAAGTVGDKDPDRLVGIGAGILGCDGDTKSGQSEPQRGDARDGTRRPCSRRSGPIERIHATSVCGVSSQAAFERLRGTRACRARGTSLMPKPGRRPIGIVPGAIGFCYKGRTHFGSVGPRLVL